MLGVVMEIKPVVFDLDDLCDQWDPWDTLHRWKDKNEHGKVTLFAIPRRCTDNLLRRYNALPWVEIAMHGWWHTTGECMYWTSEDAVEKFSECERRGFVKGFRAPKWLITTEVYEAARTVGWWIADHKMNRNAYANYNDVPRYVYNSFTRKTPWRALHGHTHDVCDNGIDEAFDKFLVQPGRKFKFVSEVVK
jgi:hypothetical protein